MATKKETLEAALRGEGCLGKASDNEPVFVLRGKDAIAAGLVYSWARQFEACHREGLHEDPSPMRIARRAKINEARACADEMAVWAQKFGGTPT